MKKQSLIAFAAAMIFAVAFALSGCEGVTNSTGNGDEDASGGTGSGDDASVATPDQSGGSQNDVDDPACVPDCDGKECGDDGCGGTCGAGCTGEDTCQNFQCVSPNACTAADLEANCADRECGGDGCGGTCGACADGQECDLASGRCTCQSDCSGRQCGPDPVCGVTCGYCDEGATCNADGVCEVPYPEGPYGTEVGDTIDNLTFYTEDGDAVQLAEFYGQEKVIIISSAAGWCSVCQSEAQELNDFYSLYDDRGLIIIYTLFEDDRGNPITGSFVRQWIDAFGLDYPVYQDVIDEDTGAFALMPFFDQDATPMNMVVTTKDMQIKYREVGYSQFQVAYQAKRYMYE